MDFLGAYQQVVENDGLTLSINEFTNDLHKIIAAKESGNFVCSGVSAHVALSMTAVGADGESARLMRKSLRLLDDDTSVLQAFQAFIDAINHVPDVTLQMANKICVNKKINISDQYKEKTGTYFRSESQMIDLARKEETVAMINNWCSQATNGKINEIITKDDIHELTLVILLNAIYFKANWQKKFDVNNTTLKSFHLNETTVIKVPTMFISHRIAYLPLLDGECILLPYVNEDLYMVIIVPKKIDDLEKIEQNIDKFSQKYENLSYYLKYYKCDMHLWLPKFKIESTIDLTNPLFEMGLSQIFDNSADFSRMSNVQIKIDKVLQKAFIEVNEEGTEAAAVTAVLGMFGCAAPPPPKKVYVDKPFIYKIMYKNCTLFSGRVMNPLLN